MSEFESVEAKDVGLSAERLKRLDDHFARYVDDGRLAGWQLLVSREGRVAHHQRYGYLDREAGRAVRDDTLWRIYSMTKPVTSVAALMLYEEGHFDLNDEISRWLPEFSDPVVYLDGDAENPRTEPARGPIRVHHLLTHTSGLTYGFQYRHVVDEIYRQRGFDFNWPRQIDLASAVSEWATIPLVFSPGEHFNYSVSTDVLGRLIEIWSHMTLDEFFQRRIFGPLGMDDTRWWCDEDDLERLASMYWPVEGRAERLDAGERWSTRPPALLSGGGGLVSTAADYWKFSETLRRMGEFETGRLLARPTVELMMSNHLPGDEDLETMAVDMFKERESAGLGFGLGGSVVIDRVRHRGLVSEGSFSWGGAASTVFWVDPYEGLSVSFFTQLLPSSTYPIRRELETLVYQSLID